MKKLLLLMGIVTISYAANGSTNYQSGGQQSTQQSVPQTSVPSDCSHLSEQEKQFALGRILLVVCLLKQQLQTQLNSDSFKRAEQSKPHLELPFSSFSSPSSYFRQEIMEVLQ